MKRSGVRRWLALPWTQRGVRERDVDDEIALHVSLRMERLIAEGVHPDTARHQAEQLFGGPPARDHLMTAADHRVSTMSLQENISNQVGDLRFILRQLRRSPAFSVAAIATIALGVGANTTMFAVVDRLLLRPPAAVRDPQRVMLASVEMTSRARVATQRVLSYPIFNDLSADSSFRYVAAYESATMSLGTGPTAREIAGLRVTPAYFAVFGVPPVAGRLFDPAADPDVPAPAEAVVSEAFWRNSLGGSSDAIGRTFELGGTSFRLIGVTPGRFRGIGLDRIDVWIPFSAGSTPAQIADRKAERQWYSLRIVARLRDGVTPAAAAASATLQVRRAELQSGLSEPQVRARQSTVRFLSAMPRELRGENPESRVAILIAAMSLFVLVLAAANVMNLQLARALGRTREISIRLALGVSRGRLLRLLLAESLLVGVLGGLAAIVVARGGSAFMRRTLLAGIGIDDLQVDWGTSLYAIALAIIVGALIGLVPAIGAMRPDLIGALRGGSQPSGSNRGLRRTLLIVQSALAIVLLLGTGLFARSLQKVESLPLGLEPDPVIVIRLNTTGRQFEPAVLADMFSSLERTTASLPEVEHAALTMSLPFGATTAVPAFLPGRDSVPLTAEGGPYVDMVGFDYFSTLRTPIVAGRAFNANDGPGAERVTVVNETTAKLWWPRESPIGKCVRFTNPGAPCTTVIGIAANARRQSMIEEPFVQLFVPAAQVVKWGTPQMIVARLRGDPDASGGRVQRALQAALPALPYVNVERLATRVASRKRSWQLGAVMFAAFGGLAVALAAIGLYGVLAYETSQRRREIGIRLALGAAAPRVTRMVVGQGVGLAGIGCVIGVIAAILTSSRIQPLLFKTSRFDPAVYAGAAGVILLTAVLASWLPAWRAGRIDPVVVLKSD